MRQPMPLQHCGPQTCRCSGLPVPTRMQSAVAAGRRQSGPFLLRLLTSAASSPAQTASTASTAVAPTAGHLQQQQQQQQQERPGLTATDAAPASSSSGSSQRSMLLHPHSSCACHASSSALPCSVPRAPPVPVQSHCHRTLAGSCVSTSAQRMHMVVAAAGAAADNAAGGGSSSSSSNRARRSRRSVIALDPAASQAAAAAAAADVESGISTSKADVGSSSSSSSAPSRQRSRSRAASGTNSAAQQAALPSLDSAWPPAAAAATVPAKARKTGRSRQTAASAAAAAGNGDVAAEARQVLAVLKKYCSTYYAGNPVVPDDVYDSELSRFQGLLSTLRAAGHSLLAQQLEHDSPLRQVGAAPPPVSSLRKVSHLTPMTSLAAVKDKSAVLAWGSRLAKQGVLNPDAVDWVVEPKVDGLAVRVVYRDGRLVLAATRGDGREGEDVTHNVSMAGAVQGLPLSLPPSAGDGGRAVPAELEVRGEVYITSADFLKLNRRQRQAGQTVFANPRNAAAGSLRLLDPVEAAGRGLSFLAYQLVVPEDQVALMPSTQVGGLEFLQQLGFATTASVTAKALSSHQARFKGLPAAISAAEQWMQQRDSVGFEVDGAVLKVDDLQLQAQLGVDAARDPRWAVAWKFPGKAATTRVLNIDWSMGRSGVLTPVAVLEPVEIGGVTVRHASLHNAGHLRDMQLQPGDVVALERAGDVVPQITGVLYNMRPAGSFLAPFPEPAKCPSCSSPLVFCDPISSGAKGTLRCDNLVCPAQQLQMQIHFVNVCVKGVGQGITRELWQRGWLNTPAGLYSITKEDLLSLPKFGDRKADNVLAAIETSRNMDLATLLAALGIEMIGKQQATHLATRYQTMKRLQLAISTSARPAYAPYADISDNSSSDAFFETAAGSSLRAWFASSDNKLLLNQLRQAGIRCCQEDPTAGDVISGSDDAQSAAAAAAAAAAAEDGQSQEVSAQLPAGVSGGSGGPQVLRGVCVCITGGLLDARFVNRAAFGQYVESLGGRFKDGLVRTVDWLVIGSRAIPGKPVPQGKRSKAAEWGIRVLTEEEFFAEVDALARQQQQQS